MEWVYNIMDWNQGSSQGSTEQVNYIKIPPVRRSLIQAAGDIIGMGSMICNKRENLNGSLHLIISQNINLIILVSMLICTTDHDDALFRCSQITYLSIMVMKENGTRKNVKKLKG